MVAKRSKMMEKGRNEQKPKARDQIAPEADFKKSKGQIDAE